MQNIVPHALVITMAVMNPGVVLRNILRTIATKTFPLADLHGDNLKKSALTSLFGEYSTDTVIWKLVPAANSQRNEFLNSVVGSKNPKIRFNGGSESKLCQLAALDRSGKIFRAILFQTETWMLMLQKPTTIQLRL